MFTQQLQSRLCFRVVTLLLILSLIVGCSASTASPTSAPAATAAPKPAPAITLNVSPGPQVPVGKGVAIVLKVDPYEKLDWKWTIVSGTSGGQLNSSTGETNVYTAGAKEGIDIIEVEAMTPSGTPIKQTVALTIVAAPDTPAPTAPAPPVSTPLPTPTMSPPPESVTLSNIQDGQEVPCENIAKGTYPLDLKDEIWPLVYVSGRYHPQDNGGQAAQKIRGNWLQTVRFGVCDQPQRDVGKTFQLVIVTADESANAAFEKYLKTGQATGNWPGMNELPPGTTEHVRIIVTRK